MIQNETELARTARHGDVLAALRTGIEAAHPRTVVQDSLELVGSRLVVDPGGVGRERADDSPRDGYDLDTYDHVYVLGCGKAGGTVAAALEGILGAWLDDGVVVTDTTVTTDVVEVVEGTHPLPSEANVAGTRRLLALAERATADDLVLVAVTGGGSALLCAPDPSVSLADYRALTDALLRSGATIDEVNAVRKHLSTVKGGQLARALAPATTVGLLFSDVVGNRLDVIASGPTAPDASTFADARAVLEEYAVDVPAPVEGLLAAGAAGDRPETPRVDDAVFDTVSNYVLADGRTALDAAARPLERAGYTAVVLSSLVEGEASEVGLVHAGIARECAATGTPFEPPVALLSGGETTVTVDGEGRGGPNQEFALGAVLGLVDADVDADPLVAAVDTDGIDGNSDAAGALVDAGVVGQGDERAARQALRTNDVSGYLAERDALVVTGPTGTNVNDLRVVVVGEP